jgi:hypothetical protein
MTRSVGMTREEWIAALQNLGEARQLLVVLLLRAKRLDDDVNEACERMVYAIGAIEAAASAIGVSDLDNNE